MGFRRLYFPFALRHAEHMMNKAAQELGRLGGIARRAALTKARRSEIARMAALAMHARKRKSGEPYAKRSGKLSE